LDSTQLCRGSSSDRVESRRARKDLLERLNHLFGSILREATRNWSNAIHGYTSLQCGF
jgi:hypothetical protein